MKNRDISRRFYGRMAAIIAYSTLIACMVEIFLMTNLSIIAGYLEGMGKRAVCTPCSWAGRRACRGS